jgi:transcriptional regulator with XRE-family HTH domain
MTRWDEFEAKLLEDPETRREYERLGPLYDAISQAITFRRARGLTQEQLAQKMGKQQPAIARFESGRVWPSLSFLQDLAEALDLRLIMRLEPKGNARRSKRVAEAPTSYSADTED